MKCCEGFIKLNFRRHSSPVVFFLATVLATHFYTTQKNHAGFSAILATYGAPVKLYGSSVLSSLRQTSRLDFSLYQFNNFNCASHSFCPASLSRFLNPLNSRLFPEATEIVLCSHFSKNDNNLYILIYTVTNLFVL